MKLNAIRVCGFRGIPPVDPPDVDIDLTDSGGCPKNLLLFGPNAFGKSSIADALEWFFKEKVRSGQFLEQYLDADTVHLNLGKPKYQSVAYIELELVHNGHVHTVRKELNSTGVKSAESLDGLDAEIERLKDEIIVLDHDQFRRFVSAANKDKWTTFSSLIGYEELDQFRSGMDSLSAKSLGDRLRLAQLKTDIERKQKEWVSSSDQVTKKFGIDTTSTKDNLKAISDHLTLKIETLLTTLLQPYPKSIQEISESFWDDLRATVKPLEAHTKAAERLGELQKLTNALTPFTQNFIGNLAELRQDVSALGLKKQEFDKRLLSDLYTVGLEVISKGKATLDECPLCKTPYNWAKLHVEIQQRRADLDFATIGQTQIAIRQQWSQLSSQITAKVQSLSSVTLTEVRKISNSLGSLGDITKALELETFDDDLISRRVKDILELNETLSKQHDEIIKEKTLVESSIGQNPTAQLAKTIEDLASLWSNWRELTEKQKEIQGLERKEKITSGVVGQIRESARQFRDELRDFSVRVVGLINADVDRYYDALHHGDNIKPFLVTDISGSQRVVSLKCHYKGIPDKDAASLLSESHRNSLGLAILLAFTNYKRKVGSPIEFCVLDDVTQSFDVGHRVNLLNLLEDPRYPEISQQQIIFLTHDHSLADLVKRADEQGVRPNWIRIDIRNWWLERMLLEPCSNPFQRAREYLDRNDEIAAAIYARRELERLYKYIIKTARIRIEYKPQPWRYDLNDYRESIIEEINELWAARTGFIDPISADFTRLFTSQRILNLTIHDSQFLENPMTLADVKAALDMIDDLNKMFSCRKCGKVFHTVRKSKGTIPTCKGCNQSLA
jgi:hypothetical protein